MALHLVGGALSRGRTLPELAVVGGISFLFSPPEAAASACRVITGGERPSAYAQFVLDPTAGNGAPMARWPRERRFAPLLGDPACSTAAACCRV
jgi:hypothetical protein